MCGTASSPLGTGGGGTWERAHSGNGGGPRRDEGAGGTEEVGALCSASTDDEEGGGVAFTALGTTTAGIPITIESAYTRVAGRRSIDERLRAGVEAREPSESPGSPGVRLVPEPTTRPSPRRIDSPDFRTTRSEHDPLAGAAERRGASRSCA